MKRDIEQLRTCDTKRKKNKERVKEREIKERVKERERKERVKKRERQSECVFTIVCDK